MHLNVRPPPLRDVNNAIPQPVEALVAKALEKAPEARHRSAAELQIDIRAAAGQSIIIRGTSSPDLVAATMPGGMTSRSSSPVAPAAPRGVPGATMALPDSTTFTGGTGQRYAPTVPIRRGTGRWWALALLVLVGAGVAGWKVLGWPRNGTAKDDRATTGSASAAGTLGSVGTPERPASGGLKPALVRLRVESTPEGASVVEVSSGRALGVTPLALERPVTAEPLGVRLEKVGFVSATRALALDRDRTETIALSASPAAVDHTAKPDPHPSSSKGGAPAVAGKTGRLAGPSKGKTARPRHPPPGEDEPAKL